MVDVHPGASAVVTFGDSITDGNGPTIDALNRWPDVLARRIAQRSFLRPTLDSQTKLMFLAERRFVSEPLWPDRGSPMTDDICAAAVSLAKEADARRAELERERQVPPDLFRRAADAGLFRQLICTELGGPGRSAVEWFRTGVEMARWEPSFSWVVTQGAADHAAFAASGHPALPSVFLADPNAHSTSSDNGTGTLVPEDGGYRLEGRWDFCSGCQGVTWVGGLATLPLAPGQEKPDALWALVPVERAKIEGMGRYGDDWDRRVIR